MASKNSSASCSRTENIKNNDIHQDEDRDSKRQKLEVLPREADILFFGDIHLTCIHPGNLSFVKMIGRCLDRYYESDDLGKLMICHGVVDALACRLPPVRFLLRNETSREWTRLNQLDALVVTAHTFMSSAAQKERTTTADHEIDAMIAQEFAQDAEESNESSIADGTAREVANRTSSVDVIARPRGGANFEDFASLSARDIARGHEETDRSWTSDVASGKGNHMRSTENANRTRGETNPKGSALSYSTTWDATDQYSKEVIGSKCDKDPMCTKSKTINAKGFGTKIDACKTKGGDTDISTRVDRFKDGSTKSEMTIIKADTCLDRPHHARLVSIDFCTTPLSETGNHNNELHGPPVYHRQISISSTEMDFVEPLSDEQHTSAFWEEMNKVDLEELRHALDCNQIPVS